MMLNIFRDIYIVYITLYDDISLFVVDFVKSFDTMLVYLDMLTTCVKCIIIVMEVVILKLLVVYLLVKMGFEETFFSGS